MKRESAFISGMLGIIVALLLVLSLHAHAPPNSWIASTSPPNVAWALVNGDGFGDPSNFSLPALEEFDGDLYAGTSNSLGAQIWRTADGWAWSNVLTSGISLPRIGQHVLDFAVFKDHLYAATYYAGGMGGEIWRSSNGVSWTRVVTRNGLGSGDNQVFDSMQAFSNSLYVKEFDVDLWYSTVWRTPDGLSWQKATPDGDVESMAIFSNSLYASTRGYTNGAALWRTDGLTWTPVMTGGFGTTATSSIRSLAVLSDQLFALAVNYGEGGGIWRSTNGSEWIQTTPGIIGNPHDSGYYGSAFFAFDGYLFLFIYNRVLGGEVWRSDDGIHWNQVGFGGWGDSSNWGTNGANSIATFHGQMFVGLLRGAIPSSQLWLYLPNTIYLPSVERN